MAVLLRTPPPMAHAFAHGCIQVESVSMLPVVWAKATAVRCPDFAWVPLLQGPRVTQTAIMSSIFFTLFEFWKAQLKPKSQREGADRLLATKLYGKKRDHIWKRQFAFR
jgi:hypothetical protein